MLMAGGVLGAEHPFPAGRQHVSLHGDTWSRWGEGERKEG